MKKIILSALALLGMGTMANAQFYVVGQDGTILYKMDEGTPAYVTFEKPITGTENGHVWVDLGLSVKWATCNVGASKPEEYGGYYAWGETKVKDYYDWSTYKWCNGSVNTLTKYCTNSKYGTVDNKTTLEKADDAATANWGNSWRMPTYAEWEELHNNTTLTWTNDYEGTGIKGFILTSTKEGHEGASIFLPAAGYRDDDALNYVGTGCYWSSSLYENTLYRGRYLNFGAGNFDTWRYDNRCAGQSVRPVCQK